MCSGVDVLEHKSCFFSYLINTSRVHWRKELRLPGRNKGVTEADRYRHEHKFDIAGPLLSSEEIQEQKLNLLNKIYAIGYNLHRYKSPSRVGAFMQWIIKIGEDG